ncbi:hypothetical protein N7470_000962 [Penicillium chermesinum]|nr:hypothetical protein N7470_000962 [Penicillium chermesinum]
MGWNVFRYLADISHVASIGILIWAIHKNKSAEGVSLITQMLYGLVFITRYLDLFETKSAWNLIWKIVFITSSIYVGEERAWKFGIYSVVGSLVLAPPMVWILERPWPVDWFMELTRVFSLILESVAILPQLILLRQTTVPTVIDSFYLVALGSYRGFYILNWLVRGFGKEHFWDPPALVCGIAQVAFYIDFAWVYYSRQRVKLRNGAIVDSDDFSKSWLVNRVTNIRVGRQSNDEEERLHDAEEGDAARPNTNRWGSRASQLLRMIHLSSTGMLWRTTILRAC